MTRIIEIPVILFAYFASLFGVSNCQAGWNPQVGGVYVCEYTTAPSRARR